MGNFCQQFTFCVQHNSGIQRVHQEIVTTLDGKKIALILYGTTIGKVMPAVVFQIRDADYLDVKFAPLDKVASYEKAVFDGVLECCSLLLFIKKHCTEMNAESIFDFVRSISKTKHASAYAILPMSNEYIPANLYTFGNRQICTRYVNFKGTIHQPIKYEDNGDLNVNIIVDCLPLECFCNSMEEVNKRIGMS